MTRPRLLLLVLLPLLAGGLYTAWWFHLAAMARDGVAGWMAYYRSAGWHLDHAGLAVEGFPAALRVRVAAPQATSPEGLAWQGADISATVNPLRPDRAAFDAPGRHHFAALGPNGPLAVTLGAETVAGELRFDRHGPVAIDARIAGAGTTGGIALEWLTLAAEKLATHDTGHLEPTLDFTIQAAGLGLPAEAATALGRRIDAATLRGTVMGAIPAGPLRPALERWRRDGGVLEIARLAVEWEPLKLTAEGTLAFDEDLQPLAAGTATIQGFFETVDALVAAGAMARRDAQLAKIVLGLLARPPAEGGRPVLTVPVSVQNGTVSVGSVAVARLPRLVWP